MSHCVTLYHLSQELGNATARHLTRLHFPLEWTERADHRRVTQLLWQCHSVTFNISPFVLQPHPGVKFCTGEPRWKVKNGRNTNLSQTQTTNLPEIFCYSTHCELVHWVLHHPKLQGEHSMVTMPPQPRLSVKIHMVTNGPCHLVPPHRSDNRVTNQSTSVDIVDVSNLLTSGPCLTSRCTCTWYTGTLA